MMQDNSAIYFHSLPKYTFQSTFHIWDVPDVTPFDELLISWNALRPSCGHYVILSRLFVGNQWTPWLLYAVWGADHQFSFHDTLTNSFARSFQDQVELLEGRQASGFSIRIEARGGAILDDVYALYACVSTQSTRVPLHFYPPATSCSLAVPNVSQLSLNHPRNRSVCSASSTAAVIGFLLGNSMMDPLQFAKLAYDAGFDIYGNWSFNIAQAFVELGPLWRCFYARLPNLKWLWNSLEKGWPVVISVKGTLPGTVLPYSSGHLIVIKGYDAKSQQFLCMDPAFPSPDQTEVSYPWSALMQAWGNRHYLTYFFLPFSEGDFPYLCPT